MQVSGRFALVAALVVIAAAAAPWHNVVSAGVTNFDDLWQFAENDLVKPPVTLDKLTAVLFASYHGQYQPVKLFSYLADNLVWGSLGVDPAFGMHLTNVLFHMANSVLVALIAFALVRDLGGDRLDPAAAAFVGLWSGVYFAVHPIHVESVAWLSSRKDVLSFFFAALAFLCARAFFLQPRAARAAGAAAFFALALGAKATIVAVPLILLAYWTLAGWRGGAKAFALVAGLVLAAAAFSVFETVLASASGYGAGPLAGSHWTQFLTAVKSFPFYMRKMLFPVGLCAVYPTEPASGLADPAVWRGAGLIAAQVAVVVFVKPRLPKLIVLWYLIALVPVLQVVATVAVPSIVADRYAYLPSVPFAVAPALILWHVRSRLLARRAVAIASALMAAALLYAGVLGAATWSRNRAWRSSEALWTDTLAGNPRSAIALTNLGQARFEKGDYISARQCFRRAVGVSPGHILGYVNIAATYEKTGDRASASAFYSRALDERSTLSPHYTRQARAIAAYGLARINYDARRYAAARGFAAQALRLYPPLEGPASLLRLAESQAVALAAVSDGLVKSGDAALRSDAARAERLYLNAADAAPESPVPHERLARVYYRASRWQDALDRFNEARRLGLTGPEFEYQCGVAAANLKLYGQAAECFSRALALDPSMLKAKANLAVVRATLGEPAQALLMLREVLEADPSNADARRNYESIREALEKKVQGMLDAPKNR